MAHTMTVIYGAAVAHTMTVIYGDVVAHSMTDLWCGCGPYNCLNHKCMNSEICVSCK